MKYKTYAEYKSTNYFQIKALPSSWTLKRLGYLADNKRNSFVDGPFGSDLKSEEYQAQGVPLIQLNNIKIGDHVLQNMKYISNEKRDQLNRHIAVSGDIVIAKMADPVARAAIVSSIYHEYVIVADCIKFTVNKRLAEPSFVVYAINSAEINSVAVMFSTGTTRIRINLTELKRLKISYPSIEEQQQIAAFLDKETAKIDKLIEKQQQLIKLLQEKRQAVISHAVTKGLNPAARMKDSGVEWLGEVPAHWDLAKIKWFFQTESGGTPNTSKYEEYYEGGSISWIRTTDLNNGDLYETPVSITEKAVVDTVCSILPINSVLVAMYGGAGTIGKHSLLKFRSAINQAVCAILPHPKVEPQYLHLYIEFYRPYWMVGAEGARKDPNINQDVIRNLVVPYPPQEEQLKIVSKVKSKLSVIDNIINKSRVAIDLLKERRTALISAAVTGKIDVQDAV